MESIVMENNLFTGSNVAKSYLKLSMPLVFSMVVSMVYNLADTYFVAATNDTNLVAGVSLCAPVFILLMAVGNIFGQGGSSLISRLLGQKDSQAVRCVSSFSFYVSIIVGAVIGIAMIVSRTPLLYLLGADSETFFHASRYYAYLAIGAPFIVASFIHTNLLRAEGMSKEAMIGTVGGAVVNIILDPIFITAFGMGAAGAAIATVLGYIFSDVYCLIAVVGKSRYLSIRMAEFKITRVNLQQILGVGVSAALTNIMQSVSMILTNQFLLPYGNDKIAAMGIAVKISMIAMLVLVGFAFGGQPLFGYFYGASDMDSLKKLIGFCVKFISMLSAILTIAVYVEAPVLMGALIDNQSVIEYGTIMLRLQVISMFFVGIILLITIVFQSTGCVTSSLLLSVGRQGIVFIIVLTLASAMGGYNGILMTQAISDTITAVLAAALFYRQFYTKLVYCTIDK